MIGKVVSHYKILEHLGSGGMGVVYKAEDIRLKRTVALKFLPPDLTRDPEAKERFTHEAQAASALDHPNICNIYQTGETDDGQLFIAMACYDGETLQQKIGRGPLTLAEAISIAIQMAEGLQKAHASGIVHRDIKPANVIVTGEGVVKILDFGLAKLSGRTILTKMGSTLGTAAYMSPEQARGEAVDERTDIWSLGVVLYEMLSGQRPFKSEYENALIYSILTSDPLPLVELRKEVPATLDQVVAKCLSKNPEDRYRQFHELIVDLRSYSDGAAQTGGSRKHTLAFRQNRRKLLRYGMAALGVLGVAVVAYVLFPSPGEIEPPSSGLKMLAVLPFENLGPAEDEYFADGLTDEITSRLSAISSLGVISRTSAIQYKKTQKTLPIIARELGVDYVLEGTVRWVKKGSGQRIRITPQLIQVAGDRHLWADNFDRTMDDIFAVQTEIATRVVEVLGIVMLAGERGLVEAIPTKNLDAYQAFLRAGSFSYYERPKLERSIALFQRAIELDSTFALAQLALSMAHLHYYFRGFDHTSQRLVTSKQGLDRAFALQPNMPEAYAGLGFYYYMGQMNYERALAAFEEARKRLPNNEIVLANIGYIWRRQGKFEEAVEQLKKVVRLNPKGSGTASEIGFTLLLLGNYAEAETYYDKAISISPDMATTYLRKSQLYILWQGDTRKGRFELERVPAAYYPLEELARLDIYDRNYQSALSRLAKGTQPVFVQQIEITPIPQLRGLIYRFMGDTARACVSFDSARVYLESEIIQRPDDYRLHMSLGITCAGLGRKSEAVQAAERAIQLLPLSKDALAGTVPLMALTHVYILIGDNDAALDQIETLLALHAPKRLTASLLRLDPIYDPLRGISRFEALLAEYE